MVRMFAPQAPLLTQVAAYTAAVSCLQQALYKHTGTFKHMMQDEEGCTAVACIGLPPFAHSEVADARGAVSTALEVRTELHALGLDAHAVCLTGKAWVGTVGSETRRDYVVIGETMQLAHQMLNFATDEHPVLVDGTTSQCVGRASKPARRCRSAERPVFESLRCHRANKARFNFTTLSVSIRIRGQLKQHPVIAIAEPRQGEEIDKQQQQPTNVSWDIAQWLRSHNKHLTSNLVMGTISDTAKHQMREVFKELDSDKSGMISVGELLGAIKEVDIADGSSPKSLRYNVERLMQEMDHDENGVISSDEFLAMAAAASEGGATTDNLGGGGATHNLPLLLTAHTTRRLLQRTQRRR